MLDHACWFLPSPWSRKDSVKNLHIPNQATSSWPDSTSKSSIIIINMCFDDLVQPLIEPKTGWPSASMAPNRPFWCASLISSVMQTAERTCKPHFSDVRRRTGKSRAPGRRRGLLRPHSSRRRAGSSSRAQGRRSPERRGSRAPRRAERAAQAAAGEEGRQGTEGLFRRGAARSRSRFCGPFYAARLLPQSPHGAAEDVVHLSGLPPGTGYPPIPDAHIKKRSEGRILPPTSDL